jgi:hypothetical protein
MSTLELFKSQLKKKQKAVGEKTFFGKEITNEDKVLFFVFKNKELACTLTKITETELPVLEDKLVLDKEDDKANTLLGAFPVFKSK